MKIHLSHPRPETRPSLAPTLKVRPGGDVFLQPPLAEGGAVACERLEDADVGLLTSQWHAYRGAARDDAVDYLRRAASLGRKVMVWQGGDPEVDIPFANVIQFQNGPSRHRRGRVSTPIAFPVFHDDVLEVLGCDVAPRRSTGAPTIGFCGQAEPSPGAELRRLAVKARERARRWRGADELPQPWPSHVRLRRRVLATLAADGRVQTDFVIRREYRHGLVSKDERRDLHHPSAMEFFDNIRRTDLTVCMRGGGNFSVRLTESLCLGRIPVVIDSGGLLPVDEHPYWRDVAVVCPAAELSTLVDRIVARRSAVDADGWAAMQERSRAFWSERLSLPGYMRHLCDLVAPLVRA